MKITALMELGEAGIWLSGEAFEKVNKYVECRRHYGNFIKRQYYGYLIKR